MMKTRDVINYTLHTGRDIFDDFAELDMHQARAELGRESSPGLIISEIVDALYTIGIDADEIILEELLLPTVMKTEEEEDDRDFIPDASVEVHARAMATRPKRVVDKTITALILSKNIRSDILLDAPYDLVVEALNRAADEQNKQMKKRG